MGPALQAHLQTLAARWAPDPSEAAKQRAGGRVVHVNNRATRRANRLGRGGPILAGWITAKRMRRSERLIAFVQANRAQGVQGVQGQTITARFVQDPGLQNLRPPHGG